MEAKELRIGNLVQYANDERVFVNLIGKSLEITAADILSIYNDVIPVEPIPLTEEWLKKFGFCDYKDIVKIYKIQLNTKINGINNFNLMINSNNEFYFYPAISSYLRVKLKFVHQLQNIYFAIIGEELTIKA